MVLNYGAFEPPDSGKMTVNGEQPWRREGHAVVVDAAAAAAVLAAAAAISLPKKDQRDG